MLRKKEEKEVSSHEKTQKNPKYIILSESCQSEKTTYYITPTIWLSEKGKTMETVKQSIDYLRWGKGSGSVNRWSTEDFEGS